MKSMCSELDNMKEECSLNKLVVNGIQNFEKEIVIEKEKIILIDENIIKNDEDFKNILENFYSKKIFSENTKIHIKLKLNLREYVIINNYLFPTFIRIKE